MMLEVRTIDQDKRKAQAISDADELRHEEKAYIAKVQHRQEEFQKWIVKNKKLSAEELICFQHQDIGIATRYWFDRAGSTINAYDQRNEHGWRNWTSSAQTVAASASQFMKDFKPLVEVASSTSPYSGAAIGVISGLFAIAKAKQDMDSTVSKAMAGIMDRLPGCDLLEQVYDGPNSHEKRLRQKVILAYTGIVDFSIAANRYYLQAGVKRWSDATFSPAKFEELAGRVQSYTTAVRIVSEEILPHVVKQIKLNTEKVQQQNEELKTQNEELKKQIARLQKDSTDRNILQLQNLLNLQEWSEETRQKNFDEYVRSWERNRQNNKIFDWMDDSRGKKYIEADHFDQWHNSPENQLLLILGRGHSRCARGHCWVSPVAWQYIKKNEVAPTLAYAILDYEEYTSLHPALSEIMLQLLRIQEAQDIVNLDPKLKHYKAQLAQHEMIEEKIESSLPLSYRQQEQMRTNARQSANDALQEIVLAIAASLSTDRTYYIVLDRLDRCESADQFQLLIILLELLKTTPARVKILAIANDLYYSVKDWQEDDLQKYECYVKVVEKQETSMR